MNNSDKLIIFIYSFFTSLGYALMLYSIKNFGYSDVYYSYFLTTVYISILFASLLYGNIKINEKNYLSYNFIGIISILLSFFFLYYVENFIYLIISVILMYFIGSSVNFIVIRFRKDIGLYYYFTLYSVFGFLVAQLLLFLKLDFKIIVLFSFILVFLLTLFTFSIYLKRILKTVFKYFVEEYGILVTTEKILSYIENGEGDILFKFIGRPTKISLLNFIIGLLYLTYWTSLVTISSVYNNLYPIFLFMNNLCLAIIYKILPKKEETRKIFFSSFYGVIIRFLGILLLLFIFKTNFYNVLIIALFYILAAISWGIFSFYMDDYILKKKENEYGFVSFFRNLASILGSAIVGLIGIQYSLFFSIFIFILIVILIFVFRKYI